MQKKIKWLTGIICITVISIFTIAAASDSKNIPINHYPTTLSAYISEPENVRQRWLLEHKSYDSVRNVSIEQYTLSSQHWPKSKTSILWKHTLIIYRPNKIQTHQALLFVNGGTRYINSDDDNPLPQDLNFARLSAETESIVVDLQDVPNQYLTFDDHAPRKEDSIVAASWKYYLDDPDRNIYWPAHLPMAKAIIKAMDAVQQIIASEAHFQVEQFVIAGASKRGWATWLAALIDDRINAIVPIVIDILNTKENINYIYASYNNQWPPAFHDYVAEKITQRINTAEFAKLMQIEDPIQYINCGGCDLYRKRLSIPKYIISASGDDFFVPDSLNLYLNKLPGETRVRVVPNQSHYIDMKIVENALLPYYRSIIKHTPRPALHWTLNAKGELTSITTNEEPIIVKLWEAVNPNTRDFRLVAKINYSATQLNGKCVKNQCLYLIKINHPLKGWKASFVEVTFENTKGETFILTTPAYIVGSR